MYFNGSVVLEDLNVKILLLIYLKKTPTLTDILAYIFMLYDIFWGGYNLRFYGLEMYSSL